MGLFEWAKGLFQGSKRAGTGLEVSRWSVAPPRRDASALIAAYKEMPWLRTIVDKVAEGVACTTWEVYRPVKNGVPTKNFVFKNLPPTKRFEMRKDMVAEGTLQEVEDHPILALLDDPSDFLTGYQIAKLQQTYLDLVGEAFYAVEFVAGIPVGLWPMPPHWVRRIPDYMLPRNEWTYLVTVGRVTRTLPAAQVIHMRHLDPDDPMGRGAGVGFALGDELDTDEYAARFTKNFFFNNSIPASVISVEGMQNPNDPSIKAWKESIQREHKGADNAGKTLFVGGKKVQIARLDTDFKDMTLVELRKFFMGFVRMVYNVPPEVVGDISSSNKATAYAARENLATFAVLPRVEFFRAHFQKFVMPFFGSDDVLDYCSPVPADRDLAFRIMVAFPTSFSHDEVREMAGKKPDPNLKGYPAPMPGQQPASPEPGGAADTAQQEAEPSAQKGDPPWVNAPLT